MLVLNIEAAYTIIYIQWHGQGGAQGAQSPPPSALGLNDIILLVPEQPHPVPLSYKLPATI